MTFVVVTVLSTFSGLTPCVAENYEAKEIRCPWGTTNSFPSHSYLVNSDLPTSATDANANRAGAGNYPESRASALPPDLVGEKFFLFASRIIIPRV